MRRYHSVIATEIDTGRKLGFDMVELWEPAGPHSMFVDTRSVTKALEDLWGSDAADPDIVVADLIEVARGLLGIGPQTTNVPGWDMEVISSNAQAG